MSFVVVVDSSSDIPKSMAQERGIVVVPMPVTIDGQTYLEGVDIFTDEFYEKFGTFAELPKTSQPNLQTLLEHYEEILQRGDEVVAIHLSSGLSSTYDTARMVRDMCSAPERVHVIDSLGASFGVGLLALLTRDKLDSFSAWTELETFILGERQKMRYIFTLDTLEYLVKGGRVSKTSGFVGNLLDVKAILHFSSEGKIEQFGKVRSRRAALRKLADTLAEEIVDPEQQVVGISHAKCLADAQILAEDIRQRVKVKDIIIGEVGCIIGSHTGPGTVALFYQR